MRLDVQELIGSNRMLASMAPGEMEALLPHLRPVELPLSEVVFDEGEPVTCVYFVTSGMISLVLTGANGLEVEVGMIGTEGVAGAGPALTERSSFTRATVQISGTALRMSAEAFREQFESIPSLRNLVIRHLEVLSNQKSQCGVCNQMHSIEERMSRWLLMAHDRAGSDTMNLTQEYIASMIGSRRPGVSLAAGVLKKAGLISYNRGTITVLDRKGLEEAACECYAALRQNESS